MDLDIANPGGSHLAPSGHEPMITLNHSTAPFSWPVPYDAIMPIRKAAPVIK